ncbi:hypothetical protein B0H14DRAFT_2635949 [Mycena olivaceomarginata]|nr:hypothetical protein B0H14DRAFT_2635949 [Mycena olivaceomarginata]
MDIYGCYGKYGKLWFSYGFPDDSHPELRAHIARLKAEIELQRALLKKLESDKILAECQLNAVLDPMAHLLEISSEIFLQTRPFPWALPDFKDHPSITGQQPGLWGLQWGSRTTGVMSCGSGAAYSSSGIGWIELGAQAEHCGRDKLMGTRQHSSSSYNGGMGWLTHWGYASRFTWAVSRREVEATVRAPLMKHLQICQEDVYTDEYNKEIWKGTPPGSLPSLETLEIRGCGYSDEELLSPMWRLKSGFLSEVITMSPGSGPGKGLGHCLEGLCLVPYLRRSEVWYCRCEEEFFAALIEFPSLLPHLIALVIHLNQFSPNSFWAAVLHVLVSCHTQFQVFSLELCIKSKIDPYVAAFFCQAPKRPAPGSNFWVLQLSFASFIVHVPAHYRPFVPESGKSRRYTDDEAAGSKSRSVSTKMCTGWYRYP